MRIAGLAVGVSLALSCSEDAGTGACGEVPERVMNFEPGALANAGDLWQRGEQVFLTLRHDDDLISLYTAERCGDGVPRQLVGPEQGIEWAGTYETDVGPLLFGKTTTGEYLHLDRLDVPGRDEPRRIIAPGDDLHISGVTGLLGGGLLLRATIAERGDLRPPGGPEAPRFDMKFYPGPGGITAPPATLARNLVKFEARADRLYALTATGELLGIDDRGDVALLQAEVRAAFVAPDGAQLAWQARGDGGPEPVYLRTLATGADAAIGVNEVITFAGLDEPGILALGGWMWTDEALALVGPGGTLLRAHARSDGALLAPPPPHLSVYGGGSYNPGGDVFIVQTIDAFQQIGLAWDPVAETVIEWYRGELTEYNPNIYRIDEGLSFTIWNPVDATRSALWLSRLDGRPAQRLIADYDVYSNYQLPDGRVLMRLEADSTADRRLVLIDPIDGSRRVVAREIGQWGLGRDADEILYTRPDGPDTGVWARPL